MNEIGETIPLRCQGCHLFFDDLQRAGLLEAEVRTLGHEAERDRLVAEGIDRKEVNRRFAKAVMGLGFLKEKLEYNEFYTVGCPGFDMSDSTGTGNTVQTGRCRSPILEI
jgi:hypothetical protein